MNKVLPVSCLSETDVPVLPTPTKVPDLGMTQRAASQFADLLALEKYAKQADVLLRSCATVKE